MDPFAMLLGMANAEVYKVTTLHLLIHAKLATSRCPIRFLAAVGWWSRERTGVFLMFQVRGPDNSPAISTSLPLIWTSVLLKGVAIPTCHAPIKEASLTRCDRVPARADG
jgi:hypothetical protein